MSDNYQTTTWTPKANLPLETRGKPNNAAKAPVIEKPDDAPQPHESSSLGWRPQAAWFLILMSWAGLIYTVYVIISKCRG